MRFSVQIQDLSKRGTPVIFLTGHTDVSEKVMAFSLGAKDYVTKPFHALELKARIDVRLSEQNTVEKTREFHKVGDLRFDLPKQKAFVEKKRNR